MIINYLEVTFSYSRHFSKGLFAYLRHFFKGLFAYSRHFSKGLLCKYTLFSLKEQVLGVYHVRLFRLFFQMHKPSASVNSLHRDTIFLGSIWHELHHSLAVLYPQRRIPIYSLAQSVFFRSLELGIIECGRTLIAEGINQCNVSSVKGFTATIGCNQNCTFVKAKSINTTNTWESVHRMPFHYINLIYVTCQ